MYSENNNIMRKLASTMNRNKTIRLMLINKRLLYGMLVSIENEEIELENAYFSEFPKMMFSIKIKIEDVSDFSVVREVNQNCGATGDENARKTGSGDGKGIDLKERMDDEEKRRREEKRGAWSSKRMVANNRNCGSSKMVGSMNDERKVVNDEIDGKKIVEQKKDLLINNNRASLRDDQSKDNDIKKNLLLSNGKASPKNDQARDYESKKEELKDSTTNINKTSPEIQTNNFESKKEEKKELSLSINEALSKNYEAKERTQKKVVKDSFAGYNKASLKNQSKDIELKKEEFEDIIISNNKASSKNQSKDIELMDEKEASMINNNKSLSRLQGSYSELKKCVEEHEPKVESMEISNKTKASTISNSDINVFKIDSELTKTDYNYKESLERKKSDFVYDLTDSDDVFNKINQNNKQNGSFSPIKFVNGRPRYNQILENERRFGIKAEFDESVYNDPIDKNSYFYKKNINWAKNVERNMINEKHSNTNKIDKRRNGGQYYGYSDAKNVRPTNKIIEGNQYYKKNAYYNKDKYSKPIYTSINKSTENHLKSRSIKEEYVLEIKNDSRENIKNNVNDDKIKNNISETENKKIAKNKESDNDAFLENKVKTDKEESKELKNDNEKNKESDKEKDKETMNDEVFINKEKNNESKNDNDRLRGNSFIGNDKVKDNTLNNNKVRGNSFIGNDRNDSIDDSFIGSDKVKTNIVSLSKTNIMEEDKNRNIESKTTKKDYSGFSQRNNYGHKKTNPSNKNQQKPQNFKDENKNDLKSIEKKYSYYQSKNSEYSSNKFKANQNNNSYKNISSSKFGYEKKNNQRPTNSDLKDKKYNRHDSSDNGHSQNTDFRKVYFEKQNNNKLYSTHNSSKNSEDKLSDINSNIKKVDDNNKINSWGKYYYDIGLKNNSKDLVQDKEKEMKLPKRVSFGNPNRTNYNSFNEYLKYNAPDCEK